MNNITVFKEEIFGYNIHQRFSQLVKSPYKLTALSLSIICLLSNFLSACAIILSRRYIGSKAHFMLIYSLTISDVMIGISCGCFMINSELNPVISHYSILTKKRLVSRCLSVFIKALHNTSLIISLLNLSAMAIDHYLAILKPLHHKTLLSCWRTKVLIIILWISSFVIGYSDFYSPILINPYYNGSLNYCERVWFNKFNEEYLVFGIAFISLALMIYSYLKIYLKIRNRQRLPLFRENRQALKGQKKTLITTSLILGTFMITWLPLCLIEIALLIQVAINPTVLINNIRLQSNLKIVNDTFFCLLLVNGILDPIIYASRVPEIRFGYKKLFSILSCRLFVTENELQGLQRNYSCSIALTDLRRRSHKNNEQY